MFARKTLVTLALAAGSVFAGGLVYSAVADARLAHAQSQAADARLQLQSAEAPQIAGTFRNVAKAISPAVVDIQVTKNLALASNGGRAQPDGQFFRFSPNPNGEDQDGGANQIPEELRRQFPQGFPGQGFPQMPRDFQQQGNGSGVIVLVDGSTGYIVTNNHVAAGASEMTVTLQDGRKIRNATLVGADQKSDIAVIKITAERLVAAPWGNSDSLEPGDLVLAFGSPFGYVGSMTQGIVSAKNRQIGILGQFGQENFVQVDAAINPGNSGGPLVNLQGEIIGINTAIATRDGGFNGLGFAVPSNQAKVIFESLRKDGRVIRGYLGVAIRDVAEADPEELEAVGFKGSSGALIGQVNRDTPAEGKLKAGDVVTTVDGQPVTNTLQFRSRIAALRPGTDVVLGVVRDGKDEKVTITLAEQPDEGASSQVVRQPVPQSLGELGLTLASPTDAQRQSFGLDDTAVGALVTQVRPGSTAARAGLRAGDLITRIGSTDVTTPAEATAALKDADLSKGLRLSVSNREGSRMLFIREK
jgi:serine protease Do